MAGLYLHIPFCRKACTYCDFHFSTSMRTRGPVHEAMLLEMEQRASELKGEALATIYFGGGTPSLLERVELEALLARAHRLFRVEKDAEVTLEVNPDDVGDRSASRG
jgi:oxygen-independent coproporphyrinogen III oxidase